MKDVIIAPAINRKKNLRLVFALKLTGKIIRK